MKAQFSQGFTNECRDVDLSGMGLYRVFKGNPARLNTWKPYRFESQPDEHKITISSACWDGFIQLLRLTKEGRLQLTGFKYPLSDHQPDSADEFALGDFWMMFSKGYGGDSVYIPFKSSAIVTDKEYWVKETRPKEKPASFLQRLINHN